MLPIAVFRFAAADRPGYFGEFLDRAGLLWQLIAIDEGAAVPTDAGAFAGIGLMGGPMSVNDPLPWVPPLLQLIRQSVAQDVPVIGHCLGGQLMAKALGKPVQRNPVKEIGWHPIRLTPAAHNWLGDVDEFLSFHWHGETFDLPDGAQLLGSSAACTNQLFSLGKHLGMQCHVEMTEHIVADWCREGASEVARHAGPTVQSTTQMSADLPARIAALHQVAGKLYQHWIGGLSR